MGGTGMGSRRIALIAAAAALAVTAAGCGGGDEAQGGAGEAGPGALEQALGLPGWDEESADDFADEQLRVEEAIAECMAGKGFEYEPWVPEFGEVGEFTEEDELEYARRNGLGVSLAWGNPDYDQGFSEEEMEDSNQEYLESLSEPEMTAYFEALDGTPEEMAEFETTETDPETGETYTVVEGAGAGCRGDAQREVTGDRDAVYAAAQPLYEEIWERVEADPRTAELEGEWSDCMAEAGFEFETEQEVYDYAYEDINERLTEVLGFDPNGDPLAALGMTEEEITELYETDPERVEEMYREFEDSRASLPDSVDREALAALHEEERTLAVAQVECSMGLRERQEELYREIEAAWVAENGDRIAEVTEEAGGSGG